MSFNLSSPTDLPISEHVEDILSLLATNQVVVVAGETGSGKSTQLPKIAYASALARSNGRKPKLIGHTQPRRIAARAVAERVAEEMGTKVGEAVSYTVRFTDTTGPKTLIKVMTDGILLAEMQRDSKLSRYDTIIIDEAHERSLNIDFLLGYLANLLPKRPDLRVIITSATIDTQRFAHHFRDQNGNDAPIVEVSGRTYPVEILYRPLDEATFYGEDEDDLDDDDFSLDVTEGIVAAVEELCSYGPGDILVFASGEGPIRDAKDALEANANHSKILRNVEVIPLFARLSAEEQHRVFAPHTKRRVVIATNIAETSLTVPGIRYVIDPGFARVSRYGRKSKVQRLPIEKISQASANQRAGRCGRIGPGIAIRLYSEDDFENRPAFTEPEILRTNLSSVILQMTSLKLGVIDEFPFIEAPDKKLVQDGVTSLEELGAITSSDKTDSGRALTDIGEVMSRLPIDPRLAKLMIAGKEQGVIDAAIICTAALSIRDIREYPQEKRDVATGLHRRFDDPASDYLTTLNLWTYLQDKKRELSGNQFRKLCSAEFINYLRWREWVDLVRQLRVAAKGASLGNLSTKDEDLLRDRADADALHKAVLVAMLPGVGHKKLAKIIDNKKGKNQRRKEPASYQGTRGTQFRLGKRSAVNKSAPEWVVCGEIVETQGFWATHVATINPDWLTELVPDQCTYSRLDPRWNENQGRAVLTERVHFRGLLIENGRSVALAKYDKEAAKALFISEGLVYRHIHPKQMTPELSRIIEHNEESLRTVRQLEDRLRARGMVDPEAVLMERLDSLLPSWVTSAIELTKWVRKSSKPAKRRKGESDEEYKSRRANAKKRREDSLKISAKQLLGEKDILAGRGFPDEIEIDGHMLPVSYTFDPQDKDADGMTIHVPAAVLPSLTPGMGAWLVPGLRGELFEALIKSLPKDIRRGLSPISQTAEEFVRDLSPKDGPFPKVVAAAISKKSGVIVTPAQIELLERPAHLQVRYALTQGDDIIATSHDLAVLQDGVKGHVRKEIKKIGATLEADGLEGFPSEPLPKTIVQSLDGFEVTGYPALVPGKDQKTLRIRVMPSEATQKSGMKAAIAQLLFNSISNPTTVLRKGLTGKKAMVLSQIPHKNIEALAEDILYAIIDSAIEKRPSIPWTREEYTALEKQLHTNWRTQLLDISDIVVEAMVNANEVTQLLAAPTKHRSSIEVRGYVLLRYKNLLYPDFVRAMGKEQIASLPRYIKALAIRLKGLPSSYQKDLNNQLILSDLQADFEALKRAKKATRAELTQLRWQLEELHVSLFANQLGTVNTVSESRLRKRIHALLIN